MTIEEILNSDDLNALYLEKVNLTTKIGSLYRNIAINEDNVDRSDYKADLSTSKAILDVLERKLIELEDDAKQNRDEQSRIRYNFMRIAKSVLTKETFEKIKGMAQNSLKDMKPMFKELRQNKTDS